MCGEFIAMEANLELLDFPTKVFKLGHKKNSKISK